MKRLLGGFLILLALNACNEFDASTHPSFRKVESFLVAQKRIKGVNLGGIAIDDYRISEFQRLKPNSSQLASRQITASYDLTLENRDNAYTSSAEVSSVDSVHWEITRLSITHQTDSIGKHFEETITWKHPVFPGRYDVHLTITDHQAGSR
jgi:hypothetical protein